MNENELMVTIPYGRLEELLDTETRAQVLQDVTIASKYNIDREEIATILGFKLPKPIDPKKPEIAGGIF